MRLCVSCVYWTLLLVSVVSSGLLFLIVASEGTQISEKPRGISRQEIVSREDAGEDTDGGYSEPVDNKVSDVRARPAVNAKNEDAQPAESDERPSSDESYDGNSESENNLNVVKQSLTPQPNLSQGISETGQAVVLTLIDTAAAELQSLAEPRLTSETRSRSLPKNVTLRTTTTGPVPASATSTTATPSFEAWKHEEGSTEGTTSSESSTGPTLPLAPESASNTTKILSSKEETTRIEDDNASVRAEGGDVETRDEIVIVRAEQKSVDEEATATRKSDDSQRDEAKDEAVKHEENLTVSPELDDGATRARLVAGGGEESAAVILDGLVATGSTDHQHHHHHHHHHHQEDIPSFSEWAQKRLEEAEKKKTHPNASIQNPGGPGRGLGGLKVRSKNYASPDCGAKIVAVNPEARSARSVLVSTRDEYMLNTCTSRVWFVVELCEAIQAKKIELANFELFSSSPRDFSVYVSDRFPTRDWSPVGEFAARDQRDVQSFNLSPRLFGKFIKVELHSHYGSEHFCPISLFRAYGTSEFEVLETETDHQENDDEDETRDDVNDEDEDEALDAESGGSDAETRNLFGSARDAVLRIVKKAAEVLVKTGDPSNRNNITRIQESIEDSITGDSFANCMTPRYTINCANCTDARFAAVFELLNCRAGHLDDILRVPFVNETLVGGGLCSFHGFDTLADVDGNDSTIESRNATPESSIGLRSSSNFLASIYTPEHVLALCNVIATKERRLVLNTSYESFDHSSVDDSSTRIDADAGKYEPREAADGRLASPKNLCDPEVEGTCETSGSSEARTSSAQSASATERESSTLSNSANATSATTSSATTIAATTATASPARFDGIAAQIRPTRALSRDDPKKDTTVPTILESNKHRPDVESAHAEVTTTTPSPAPNLGAPSSRTVDELRPIQNFVDATSTRDVASSTNREHREAPEANDDGTTARQEHGGEREAKTPSDNGEHEAKIIAQDQMSLDSILSDLKDLEGDANIHGNANQNANVVAQPTASTTPQQKESVFLRLSNRIKALERNMSLSGQYLEELSKRYKKQVEEMQRSLERATSAMSEESRKGEERELRRIEEISSLREEITSLAQSLEILLYDRNSWRSKLSTVCQHFVLVIVEIVVFVFVVTYCRRSSTGSSGEFEDADGESNGAVAMNSLRGDALARRRSAATSSCCGGVAAKRARKRRPSEIAARIVGGTYRELMIEDRPSHDGKRKEKRKRRKRESTSVRGTTGTTNGEARRETSSLEEITVGIASPTSGRSSSNDPATRAKQPRLCQSRERPDSAPEYSGLWNDDRNVVDRLVTANSRAPTIVDSTFSPEDPARPTHFSHERQRQRRRDSVEEREREKAGGTSLFRGGGILRAKLSSPSFVKAALGSRSKRTAGGKSPDTRESADARTTTPDDWDWYSRNSSNRSDSGSPTSLLLADVVDHRETVGRDDSATRNGRRRDDESESGGSSNAAPNDASKKDKKTGRSLRKMVRKLF